MLSELPTFILKFYHPLGKKTEWASVVPSESHVIPLPINKQVRKEDIELFYEDPISRLTTG